MRIFFPFLLLLSYSSFASTPNWNCDLHSWNNSDLVKMYFHHSELQRQWAWELLGKCKFNGDEKVLDFGSGDGKVSAEISRLLPNGKVVGVDTSEEMNRFSKLKFPTYAYPNLEFEQSPSLNFSDFPSHGNFDVVTAFCVFHLVPDPLSILQNLKAQLKPGGKLLLVVPAGKNAEFFRAANETFLKYGLKAPWQDKPVNALTMRTLEGSSEVLRLAGFEVDSIEMIDTDNPFYDIEELISWMVGTTTANWDIPVLLSKPFFTDLANKMIVLDPKIIDEEGRIHFKLSRIHVIAKAL